MPGREWARSLPKAVVAASYSNLVDTAAAEVVAVVAAAAAVVVVVVGPPVIFQEEAMALSQNTIDVDPHALNVLDVRVFGRLSSKCLLTPFAFELFYFLMHFGFM